MKECVECKTNKATHWSGHLCEKCFRELLADKAENS